MIDDLRDRMAGHIWQNSSLTPEGAAHIAQAVIEDLGLVVEEWEAREPVPVRRFGRTEWDNREVTLYRVVGRWEER